MSAADLTLSGSIDQVEFPYRALSRAAVVSILFAVLATIGLIPTFMLMLAAAVFGLFAGLFAFLNIRRYPEEYSGYSLACVGLIANAALLIGGSSLHVFTYLTEVPDGYNRVHFYELQMPEAEGDAPTTKALEIDGEKVFLKGYIHPTSGSGMLREFVLVPDLGTCCFGGQPRSSDMIQVRLLGGQSIRAGLLKRKLAGTFELSDYGRSVNEFDNVVFYRMKADQIR